LKIGCIVYTEKFLFERRW